MYLFIYLSIFVFIPSLQRKEKGKIIAYLLLRCSDVDQERNNISEVCFLRHLELIESFISENTE